MPTAYTTPSAKVLVVDDLPEKLLVYRTILEHTAGEVVTASSGAEALKLVLQHDFAVILLDVNMPGMDGFEAARLIRSRKRSSHTPIIFVTAHVDEVHALRGYEYGAVDFILTPVVPDILRTKVRVFVQLYELNQQVREQAARQLAQAEREHARLETVLERAIDFVAKVDRNQNLTWINRAGRLMLGYGGAEQVPQRLADVYPESALTAISSRGFATAEREGVWFADATLRTREGREIPVAQVLVAHPSPEGQVEYFSVVARDVSKRLATERALSESEQRYRQLVQGLPAAVYTCDAEGCITLYNAAAVELWGREPKVGLDRWCGSHRIFRPDGSALPLDKCPMAIAIREGRSVRGEEIIIERPDGTRRHIAPYPEPVRDSTGRVVGAVNMLVDITERKSAEQELLRHREHLEQLVRERTEELEASLERLRLSDRLASVGTLAAGLGHDMGNLLMPVRMRLDALNRMELPAEACEDLTAIGEACEYLKRLSQGLRLFALNPDDRIAAGDSTNLTTWWSDVSGFMRNTLHRGIELAAELPENLPPVPMAPHLLTQTVYNLVQNADNALQGRGRGKVRISAARGPRGIVVSVSDNGPGMSEEVKRRCIEPFFTTKSRGISTGLGLALVHGAMRKAGGDLNIVSRVGEGTTFELIFPIAHRTGEGAADMTVTACVHLHDARMRAYASILLRSLGVEVSEEPWSVGTRAALIVVDEVADRGPELAAWLAADPSRRVVQFGGPPPKTFQDQWTTLAVPASAADVRRVLRAAAARRPLEVQEVAS